MPKKRQAVSIILTRNPDNNEIYLVERNPDLKFFGGYYAFPGGTLDRGDDDIPLRNDAGIGQEEVPYILAAAREVFEETGILLSHGETPVPAGRLNAYRQQLLQDEIAFAPMLKREGHYLEASDYHFVCTLLTPEFAPVRYDTRFYWVQLPDNQMPEIVKGELVAGDFYRADTALEKWWAGGMDIVPPVVFMLQHMQTCSLREAMVEVLAEAQAYSEGEIHQIYFTPGIQMLPLVTRTLPPATHTNAYLIGESALYLVDPAASDPREQQRLWTYLDKRLSEGRVLKGILLTHHHSDHVGAVAECQKRYDLPLFAHENTISKLPHLHFDGAFKHGDVLDLGKSPDGKSGWKLEVLHTPGHASGHLALRENRYGAVIAGDMISTLSTIVISPPDGHLATYMKSLELLKSVTDGCIYPSHGSAVKDGKGVLEYFIRHRQEREEKLMHALNSKPQSVTELVQQVYDDVDRSIWPLAKHSLQAGLIKLEEEGKCEKAGGGYVRTL